MRRILASFLLAVFATCAIAQVPIYTRPQFGAATSVSSAAFPLLGPNGSCAAPTYSYSSSTGTGMFFNGSGPVLCAGAIQIFAVQSGGVALASGQKLLQSNGINTVGEGVPLLVANGRSVAATAAIASVLTYTVPAADSSFEVSANVLVTTSTTHSFTVTCAYTDEGNTARTVTLNFSQLAGTLATTIANAAGAVPYEGIPLHIRAKASTAITIATTGTFTTVTYNVEGIIKKTV